MDAPGRAVASRLAGDAPSPGHRFELKGSRDGSIPPGTRPLPSHRLSSGWDRQLKWPTSRPDTMSRSCGQLPLTLSNDPAHPEALKDKSNEGQRYKGCALCDREKRAGNAAERRPTRDRRQLEGANARTSHSG
jgi:hypothetical protein